jgi:hypothetical protein
VVDALLLPLVDTNTDQVRAHELCPNRGQKVIGTEFDQRELPSIEDDHNLEQMEFRK